jgi:hypothetical protein
LSYSPSSVPLASRFFLSFFDVVVSEELLPLSQEFTRIINEFLVKMNKVTSKFYFFVTKKKINSFPLFLLFCFQKRRKKQLLVNNNNKERRR